MATKERPPTTTMEKDMTYMSDSSGLQCMLFTSSFILKQGQERNDLISEKRKQKVR